MSIAGCITTEGHYTTNPAGFLFNPTVTYQSATTYYGRYCGDIDGWDSTYPERGGIPYGTNAVSVANGPYYHRLAGLKGTISSVTFLLLQIATNYSARGTVTKTANSGSRFYGEYVVSGASITISATPKTGYKFYQWSDGNTNTSRVITVYGDASYTAVFVPITYILSRTAIGLGSITHVLINGVEKDLASQITFVAGDTIQATQTPNINATFSSWVLGGVQYNTPTLLVAVSSTTPPIDGTITLQAIFQTRDSFVFTATNTTPLICTVGITDGVTPRAQVNGVISFTAYVGVKYTITTTVADLVFNKIKGIYNGTTLLSSAASYEFTQNGAGNISLTVTGEARPLYTLATGVSDGSSSYGMLNPAAGAGCSAEITTAVDATVSDVGKYLEKNVSIQATAGTGWELTGWNIQNADGGAGGFTPATAVNPLTFLIAFNAFVKINFARQRFTPSVSVRSESEGKGTVVVVSTNPAISIDNLRYGDSATFTAAPNSPSGFGGWYTPDQVLVSTANPYEVALSSNLALVAHFTTTITIRASYIDPALGTCTIDGNVTDPSTKLYSQTMRYGVPYVVVAIPEPGSYFSGWFATSDTTFSTPLSYGVTFTATATGVLDITARFSLTQNRYYLAVVNMDNNPAVPIEAAILGHITSSGGVEITEAAYNNWAYGSMSPMGFTPDTAMPGQNRYYQFDGVINAGITAIGATGRRFVFWGISDVTKEDGVNAVIGDETTYSNDADTTLVINKHYRLRAYWGEIKPVTIRVAYGNGFGTVNGVLEMDNETDARIISNGEITDDLLQTTSLTITARQKNGYLFDGWYTDPNCLTGLRSNNPIYTFTVDSPVTLYAKFIPDTNAIYEWAGDETSKNALWVSKRYTSGSPFSPSAARVYATGYPTSLQVSMFESPNTESAPAGVVRVTPTSQNAVRLPRVRAEKYMTLSIGTGYPVEAIAVSTSMKGLIV